MHLIRGSVYGPKEKIPDGQILSIPFFKIQIAPRPCFLSAENGKKRIAVSTLINHNVPDVGMAS